MVFGNLQNPFRLPFICNLSELLGADTVLLEKIRTVGTKLPLVGLFDIFIFNRRLISSLKAVVTISLS